MLKKHPPSGPLLDIMGAMRKEVPLPKPQQNNVPALVLGGKDDLVMDETGCRCVFAVTSEGRPSELSRIMPANAEAHSTLLLAN